MFRSVYVGSGEVAGRVAEQDRRATQARREAAASWRGEREAIDDEDRARAAAFAAIGEVVRAILQAARYHRHKRGAWRRKRMGGEIARRPAPIMPGTHEQCEDAIVRAFAGDESALPMIVEMFEAAPSRMLAVADASLAHMIQAATVARIAGGCAFTMEALPRQVDAMRRELAGPSATAIERLVADRAALCWLEVTDWDMRCARAVGQTESREEHLDRMRGRAIRRYQEALKSLARVRKIVLVAVQVTIEKRQVNIGKGDGPTPR